MKYLKRNIENKRIEKLKFGKVIIIFGLRRVGKTKMIEHIIQSIDEGCLLLNGEDMDHVAALEHRSSSNFRILLGGENLLVIDEAQAISDIGLKLKLMIDTISNLRIIATGSSAFDLNSKGGGLLVGRELEFRLFSIAQMEFANEESYIVSARKLSYFTK